MKQFLTLLISLIVVLLSFGQRVQIGDLYYNLDSTTKTAEVTTEYYSIYESSYPNLSGSLTIPSNVNYNGSEYSVTEIGDYAFYYCSGLTNVTIPNSVTSIGYGAFSSCSGLTSVTIPNSVTKIGGNTFYECTGLTSVTIPNSVTKIGDYAFYYCSGLTSVTIPISVTSIGEYTFYGCSGLTNVTIPNSVTEIGYDAFYGCSGLTSLTIPNSVTEIGYDAFKGCTSLAKVEISDIAAWCKIKFSNYLSNPLSYAHHLYLNDAEIKDLVIPNSVTSIGQFPFKGCSGLTSVTIPNSVTEIGYDAFYGCSGLTSVSIGNSVTSIGSGAFEGCTSLAKVEISDIAAWCNISFPSWNSNPLSLAHHLYLSGAEIKELDIPDSVTSIRVRAFCGWSGLTKVTIPNSVTSIESFAFDGCTGLTNITIPNSVTTISGNVFPGCTGLKSVIIGSSVTLIGNGAFSGCTQLESIIFNTNGFLEIYSSAFSRCENINKIICRTTRPPYAEYQIFPDNVYSSANLYVPADQLNAYYSTTPWNKFANIKPLDSAPGEDEPIYEMSIVLYPQEKIKLKLTDITDSAETASAQWQSSNVEVAAVAPNGVVTALELGTTTISASLENGQSFSLNVEVAVEDILSEMETVVISKKSPKDVYLPSGILLIKDATAEEIENLDPGIYIIGGKKVIVK